MGQRLDALHAAIYIYNWSVLCCAVQGGKVSKFTGWEAVRIANTHEGAGMQGRI